MSVPFCVTTPIYYRTIQPRHIQVVEAALQDLWKQGDMYAGDYEGWYCVPDERFWTEKDLVEGGCPDCGRPVERLVERNYFFRMSRYQVWLVDYIKTRPDFIRPISQRNEVLGFLRQPSRRATELGRPLTLRPRLRDLCLVRRAPELRHGGGIPLRPRAVWTLVA